MSELTAFLLGAGAIYLLTHKGIIRIDGGISVGVDKEGLPMSGAGGGAPGDDTARETLASGNPILSSENPGILPPVLMAKPDVVGTYRSMYGRGYGNRIADVSYAPSGSPKFTPYEDDIYNSAADNNGGMVIGSGYR